MKTLIRAHLVTAILGWISVVVMAGTVISEGSLVAIGSLCLVGVATAITILDILSVYFTRKGKAPFLATISTIFWVVVLVLFSLATFSPNQPWQSRSAFGALILISVFKIKVSVSLRQVNETSENSKLI